MLKKKNKKTRIKTRNITIWIAVSPINEGANIYMPSHCHDFFESFNDARRAVFEEDEIVKAKISYRKVEQC